MALEIFQARGVESYPVQLVQHFSPEATLHWAGQWRDKGLQPAWIDGEVIYHEGCAVVVGDDEIKLWDASAGAWIDPRQAGGYGSLLSFRVLAPQNLSLRWGGQRVPMGSWTTPSGR
jgi:hypothetical protein